MCLETPLNVQIKPQKQKALETYQKILSIITQRRKKQKKKTYQPPKCESCRELFGRPDFTSLSVDNQFVSPTYESGCDAGSSETGSCRQTLKGERVRDREKERKEGEAEREGNSTLLCSVS